MNSTPNTRDDLISRADEQIARAYEQIARADEEIARVSEQFSKIERGAAHDPPVGSAAQAPHGRLTRRGLVGLLSAICIVGLVVVFVLQSSHGGVMLTGAQWAPQLISTPSLPSKNPPFPAQPDPSPVQVTAAEAAPPQAAPLSHTGPQDAATAASAASELTQLLQKMTGDIANLEQAMEQLKAKQDQIASDNAKAIEQLKTKQEDTARLLAKVSEQSALPKTSPPSAGPTQSPRARTRPQAPQRRQYPPRWQYYDDEW
jgi:DNA repair exonuclease SbcCD ATPase subunit